MAFPTLQDGPYLTLKAAANLAAGARVKIDSNGDVALAGLTDAAIGYVTERGATSGEYCTVKAAVFPAMAWGKAHSAIAVGALLYGQASGRIDDADGGSAKVVGYAASAAAAQDDVFAFYRVDG